MYQEIIRTQSTRCPLQAKADVKFGPGRLGFTNCRITMGRGIPPGCFSLKFEASRRTLPEPGCELRRLCLRLDAGDLAPLRFQPSHEATLIDEEGVRSLVDRRGRERPGEAFIDDNEGGGAALIKSNCSRVSEPF